MIHLPEVVLTFYQDRKEKWQKKNITDKLDEFQKLEKLRECEEIFKHEKWILDAAERIASRALTTHPSKFSHPSTGVGKKNRANGTYVSPIFFKGKFVADGLFRTGNVHTQFMDSVGNAAELDVEEFLRLEIDGQSILDHIEQDSEIAKQLLTIDDQDYQILKKHFLAIKASDSEHITNTKIKQVYYPIISQSGTTYYLLSLLTNSAYLFEQRKRIDEIRFSDATKEARELKRQNKYSELGFKELYDITTIGFGGTKPANISILNNLNAGKAHLFESIPPYIKLRDVRIPTRNFFTQTLNRLELKKLFFNMNGVFKNWKNNIDVKNELDELIKQFVDYCIEKRWQVYMLLENQLLQLSSELPIYQRIWLSPDMQSERDENDLWLDELIIQLSRTFFYLYEKTIGKDAFKFGHSEYLKIKEIIEANRESLK